jgi:hypothetical protein
MQDSIRQFVRVPWVSFVAEVLAVLCSLLIVVTPGRSQCADAAGACPPRVPPLVRFTGVLRDVSGKAFTGTVGITFAIYKDSSGGVPLWQETQNVQLDQQGRYAVLLGAAKLEGVPPELFSSGEPRWLGVQVQLPGESERPRTQLVSVPYALKAADTETLGGLPPSAFVRVSPDNFSQKALLSDGNATNSTTHTVVGAVAGAAAQSADQSVATPGGTANALPKFSTPSTIVDSQITDSEGIVSMQNLSNILFAERFPGGVPDAIAACPAKGCVIYAISPKVNLNLGTIDPGSKAITLYLGPYTYNVTQIMLRRELQIIGMGSGITFLQSVNGNNPVIVIPQETNPAVNVLLTSFRLIGSVGNTSEDAMLWDSSAFFNSGVWYSEVRDIFITGFAGNSIHLVGSNANFSGVSQWVQFNRVIVFRPQGGGNGLRIEGAAYELYFNDCQFDGTAPGDGTNIFIGARPGNSYAFPVDINFRGLTSQNSATAAQIDGGWALSFYSPHHEFVWGVYHVTADLGAPTHGLTISDAQFLTVGANNGAGYLLKVDTPYATGVRLIHSQVIQPVDAVVLSTSGASIVYKDNEFFGGTDLPLTRGITTQLTPAPSINISGAHTIGLTSSATSIVTIQSSLGSGETATFFTINGPVTFGAGGNINLMGATTLTVHGSITFMVSDMGTVPVWIPVSQWQARLPVTTGFILSTTTPSLSIPRGGSATFALTLTPQGGFSGSVSFSCSGAPSGMSCSVSPNPLLVSGPNAIETTVSVDPKGSASADSRDAPGPHKSSLLTLLSFGWMGLVVVAPGAWRQSRGSRPMLLLGLLLLIGVCWGCGAVAHSQTGGGSGTSPGIYRVAVTAMGGAETRTINFVLNLD